jgi:hypothetical protein
MEKKTLTELRDEPGMSNAGKYKNVAKGDFCGPNGTYPVPNLAKAKSALKLAHNAKGNPKTSPQKIIDCVLAKYPELKKGSKKRNRRK